jgi:1-acyl-sn-glycerol-3-phosphate acyltransferase
VKKDEMGGHVVRIEEKQNAYRVLVGKPEGKRTPGKHRRKFKAKVR